MRKVDPLFESPFQSASFSLILAVSLILFSTMAVADSQLRDAAISGDVETLTYLLENGGDPNHSSSEGSPTLLTFATDRGHASAVAVLLEHGADVDAATLQGSALHVAARRGRLEIAKLLLDAGADPNHISGELLRRPLHDAAYKGSVEIASLLLDAGADVNGRSPLKNREVPAIHVAALRGHEAVVTLLRERGFQPFSPDPITSKELKTADLELGRSKIQPCFHCHSSKFVDTKYEGAPLWGIVGKRKASEPNKSYSDAMRREAGVWDYEALNVYLADVCGSVPGTFFCGGIIRDRASRIAVIAYLRTMADEPMPLP